MSGPVSRALTGSALAEAIRAGLQAIPTEKRQCIDESLRAAFADSLDLDEATREQYPNDARWDYLIGHTSSSTVVAVETHSAQTSQVSLVIQKRAASRRHLQPHLRNGHSVAAWYWVASGKVDFVPHEKMLNHLNENGIEFVGRRLTAKHLALVAKQGKSSPGRRRRSRK